MTDKDQLRRAVRRYNRSRDRLAKAIKKFNKQNERLYNLETRLYNAEDDSDIGLHTHVLGTGGSLGVGSGGINVSGNVLKSGYSTGAGMNIGDSKYGYTKNL